jgi:hypothetical protein
MPRQWGAGILVLIWLFVVHGCRYGQYPDDAGRSEPVRRMQFRGLRINVFDTAQAQLAWAASLQDDPERTRIALQFILHHFADNRTACGQAELRLAYLELGQDFRLTGPAACERAARSYAVIADHYADIPWIRAKALWYRGWILADLLHRPARALPLFEQVAAEYGEVAVKPSLDEAWRAPLSPEIRQQKSFEILEEVTWSEPALLKIIEHSPDPDRQITAFRSILRRGVSDRITGRAILQLLQQVPPSPVVVRAAHGYVNTGKDSFLKKDIRIRLEQLSKTTRHGADT